MRLFGISFGELLAAFSLFSAFIGILAKVIQKFWFDDLTKAIHELTAELKESKEDRRQLHKEVGELDDKILKIDGKQDSLAARYNDHLEFFHGVEKGGHKHEN